ncbi:NuA4-domain-containing protein [Pseudovirgaria hyperparasitica]|uniref:Chromatin modification-related protein EAF6 n=1 Tax=Pseudovirgaria hyperparasitica TaxID=470096 RepID=A0A6A6VWE0_9PEZI|nr:NuA4-domain-containing protein [Pseudovirgaria hyperparasitica]KAF2754169.1 NuA4-domain-containing protein [Pseudovirgaria hyperparasitica]
MMSENAPPTQATATNTEAQRGMPYYEQLTRELKKLLSTKRALDQERASLDEHIYKLETAYLEETTAGNIIKGFDNYIKGTTSSTATTAGTSSRRRGGINDADRIFSRSSTNFARAQSLSAESGMTTPSAGAATPASVGVDGGMKKENKKKKKGGSGVGEDDEGGKAKRTKIAYA